MELDPKYDDYDFPTKAPVEAPGHPGHLKPEEQAQVNQLRLMLESEGFTKRLDTLTLVRSRMPLGVLCSCGWPFANTVASFGSSAPASLMSWPPRRCKMGPIPHVPTAAGRC